MMRTKTPPFFLSLAILLVAAAAHEQEGPTLSPAPTPCPKPTFNTKHIPFNASSLLCSNVWPSEDFVLMFEHADDYMTWSFVLSAPNNGSFIAIGFSKDGAMVGSSAVVGWLAADGKGTAKQYFLGGKNPELCKPDKGDLDLVKGKTVIIGQSSRLYLAFQLNTSIDQPKNRLIYSVGPTGKIPGADHLLPIHRDMLSTTINYATEHNAPAPSPMPEGPSQSGPIKSSAPKLNLSGRLVATTLLAVGILLAVGLL